jgi:hypothetical protein
MKTLSLVVLIGTLVLATNAMADNTAYNSKANSGKVLAPSSASTALVASDFNGVRQNSKVQTVAPANVQVIKTDRAVTCSKPMDKTACATHCG